MHGLDLRKHAVSESSDPDTRELDSGSRSRDQIAKKMKGERKTMKVKRFIVEYANYKIDLLNKSGISDEAIESIRKIDRAVRLHQQGLLTVDETIRIINET